jgi:hypothetical protein
MKEFERMDRISAIKVPGTADMTTCLWTTTTAAMMTNPSGKTDLEGLPLRPNPTLLLSRLHLLLDLMTVLMERLVVRREVPEELHLESKAEDDGWRSRRLMQTSHGRGWEQACQQWESRRQQERQAEGGHLKTSGQDYQPHLWDLLFCWHWGAPATKWAVARSEYVWSWVSKAGGVKERDGGDKTSDITAIATNKTYNQNQINRKPCLEVW